ncbi:MAG: CotH kinase family protein [Flavobacteriales bacterium]
MKKRFLLILACAFCTSGAAFSQVLINEYSAANRSSYADGFGEYEDWIELYNAGGAAVNLGGYHLSDNGGNTTKWPIPAVNLGAGQRMVFFASGRDGVFGGQYHTNFKITQTSNEPIIFADPSGAVLDNVITSPNQNGHSTGRTTDGAATWSVFTTATPNAANGGTPYTGYAATATMSVPEGFYGGGQNVTLSTVEPNSQIRYTTNGSTPTTTSTLYTGPIAVNATTVLRARVFSNNPAVLPSYVASNTYFIGVTHGIAVISIFGDNIATLLGGSQITPQAGLEYFEANGAFVAETYGDANEHGNDSWAYAQRGIDYIARDQFGYADDLDHPVFNRKSRQKYQRLIIKAAANDNYPFANGAHIRDSYVTTLSQQGGLDLDGRTWEPVIMYVNGQYWGVYDVREKVDDKDYTDYYYDYDENELQFLKTWGGTWSEYGGGQAQTDWNTLRNYIMSNNMGVAANFAVVDAQYNWRSLVDYFCLNSYTVCTDWLNWNTAWWRGTNDPGNPRAKWSYALWDMDATFGHYINYTNVPDDSPGADPCNAEALPDPGGQGHALILTKLINENPTVKQYYISRYIDLGNTTFSCTNMIHVLDSMLLKITPEMPGQIARWGGTMAGWQTKVQELKDFINDRCVQIQQGMVDCYNVSGPYQVNFDVMPAGAGTIKVNSLMLPSYPFNGTYYGNIDILLKAYANAGYEFDYWQAVDPVLPTINDSDASIQITGAQTIIAHFKQIQDPELTFLVDPPLSGNIDISGFVPPAYAYTNTYLENSNITMSALAAAGYVFDYWELDNHTVLPSVTDANVAFAVTQNDTVIAHFKLIPLPGKKRLTVWVDPVNSGDADINGFTPGGYPYSSLFDSNTVITAIALPQSGYTFGNWTIQHHALSPSATSPTVTFTISANDTLIAHFSEVPEEGPGVPEGPTFAFIPNSFTPNNDGVNDTWNVSISYITDFDLRIFSRWGETVFATQNIYDQWRGTYHNGGEPLKSDTYAFIIKYKEKDGKLKEITGGVNLIR